MPRTSIPVGGVDLGCVTLQEADAFAESVVLAGRRAGVDPCGLLAGTHRIVPRSGDLHLVVTVTAAGADDEQMWRLCTEAISERPRGALACTAGRHNVGDGPALEVARSAVHERALRIGGRCVHFPGVELLTGTLTVGQILAASAVEVVVEVGGAPLACDAEVVTGAHVRPRWEFGALTLHVQHEGLGLYLPFEAAPSLARRGSPAAPRVGGEHDA